MRGRGAATGGATWATRLRSGHRSPRSPRSRSRRSPWPNAAGGRPGGQGSLQEDSHIRLISTRLVVIVTGSVALAMAGCSSGASPSAPAVSANFKDGIATVSLTGTYTAKYPAQLKRGNFVDGGAAMIVEYGNVQTGSLTYQGPATPGTYATERTDTSITTIAFTVVLLEGDKPSDTFASTSGECSITIVEMTETEGDATFICSSLSNPDGTATIDATGTFSVVP